MGVASVLAGVRAQLRGSVKFIFQPAEEMPPEGEEGGARMMVAEGALENPAPRAIFGLHVTSRLALGVIGYRPGPTMASSDKLKITVHGKQTHGAAPWLGVDPIVTAAQVILGLQTMISRGTDIAREPAVVTIGMIRGGVRENIIPDSVEMRGTMRVRRGDARRDPRARDDARRGRRRARGRSCIDKNYPVTVNDPALTEAMVRRWQPRPARAAWSWCPGDGRGGLLVLPAPHSRPVLLRRRHAAGRDPREAPANHSPLFHIMNPP